VYEGEGGESGVNCTVKVGGFADSLDSYAIPSEEPVDRRIPSFGSPFNHAWTNGMTLTAYSPTFVGEGAGIPDFVAGEPAGLKPFHVAPASLHGSVTWETSCVVPLFVIMSSRSALTIVDPSSYTDYAQSAQIIADDLKAAGINATFHGLTVSAWNADMASGNFQLALHWGSPGITPYSLYDTWLDDTLISTGNGDYERLKNPAIQADLQKLTGDVGAAEQTADLAPIEQYVATQLPVIPTTTAADWFEYNSRHFTGWPTQQNPYDSGQPSGNNNGPGTGSDEVVVLHLKPA